MTAKIQSGTYQLHVPLPCALCHVPPDADNMSHAPKSNLALGLGAYEVRCLSVGNADAVRVSSQVEDVARGIRGALADAGSAPGPCVTVSMVSMTLPGRISGSEWQLFTMKPKGQGFFLSPMRSWSPIFSIKTPWLINDESRRTLPRYPDIDNGIDIGIWSWMNYLSNRIVKSQLQSTSAFHSTLRASHRSFIEQWYASTITRDSLQVQSLGLIYPNFKSIQVSHRFEFHPKSWGIRISWDAILIG